MITDDTVKPRMALRKQYVLGFYKHDHELLGATKKNIDTLNRLSD
jgi:hypothetical protein